MFPLNDGKDSESRVQSQPGTRSQFGYAETELSSTKIVKVESLRIIINSKPQRFSFLLIAMFEAAWYKSYFYAAYRSVYVFVCLLSECSVSMDL